MPVRALPEEVINKIAAGEVVERPASVVKELVENSIDACADDIKIEVWKSGKELIKVVDNGFGMTKEDLLLAFKRYTTSKISSYADIFDLKTLGFRGEALAAIASVSKIRAISKSHESEEAWEIEIEAGNIKKITKTSMPTGTMVEVRDLFFNTPVREKFLKSDYIEFSEIARVVEEYALANFDISFHFLCDGREILMAPKVKNLAEKIYDVLGKDIFELFNEIHFEDKNMKLSGFILKPVFDYSHRRYQYFFINRRPVTSRILTQALYDAYRDFIPKGRHPACVIFLELNPSLIDVNVHPTKRVVKFSDERMVYENLFNTIKKALEECKVEKVSEEISLISEKPKVVYQEQFFSIKPPEVQFLRQEEVISEKPLVGTFKLIGTLFNTYILLEDEDGLVIVDQHAACERILYERLSDEAFCSDVEMLLIPYVFTLPASQTHVLKENFIILNSFGFGIEEFGHNTFVFKSFPKVLGGIRDAKKFIDECINTLLMGTTNTIEFIEFSEMRERVLKYACKAAVKASDFLSKYESIDLVKQLLGCKQPYRCPHGRPTMIKVSVDELGKKFLR